MVLYVGSVSSHTALGVSIIGIALSNWLHLCMCTGLYVFVGSPMNMDTLCIDIIPLVGGYATAGVMYGNCSTTHDSCRGIHL